MEVSIYRETNANTPYANLSVADFVEQIRHSTEWQADVEYLRGLSDGEYKNKKREVLEAFTTSGTAKTKARGLTFAERGFVHNGLIQLDIDKIETAEQLAEISGQLAQDVHSMAVFSSPSGRGVKAIFCIDGLAEKFNKAKSDAEATASHKLAFDAVAEYILERYQVKIDPHPSSPNSLCFVSSDGDAMYNPSALPFVVVGQAKPLPRSKLEKPKARTTATKPNENAVAVVGNRIAKMITGSDGTRHGERLKAGKLLGGFVAGGLISEVEAEAILFAASDTIADGGRTSPKEVKAIKDAIQHGKGSPIYTLNSSNSKEIVNKETGEISSIDLPFCFWYIAKNELAFDERKLWKFIAELGFKLIPAIEDSKMMYSLVFAVKRVIEPVSIEFVRLKVVEQLEKLPFQIELNFNREQLIAKFSKGLGIYISKEKTALLGISNLEMLEDSSDISYIPYRNGILEITASGSNLVPYSQHKLYVWKSHIKQRDYKYMDFKDFEFWKFTQNQCTDGEEFDLARHVALTRTIGYLVHRYKTSANNRIVIFTEANLSLDDSNGGTGKSLLMVAISMIRKVALLNGKMYRNTPFGFQSVTLDDEIIFLDDVLKSFDITTLNKFVTGGLETEAKHQARVHRTVEQSPKWAVSTNTSITDTSGSTERRSVEMELYCHYSAKHTPLMEFGRYFFSDWQADDWHKFDSMMAFCCEQWLLTKEIKPYHSGTIEQRKLAHATSKGFVEFADSLPRNEALTWSNMYDQYIDFEGFKEKDSDRPTSKKFGQWLSKYGAIKKLEIERELTRRNGIPTRTLVLRE